MQLWGLDCFPKAQSMILTLNRLRNMSFQPLCVCARVVNCFHVFDRWLGVPRSEANILLNKQWGERREEEWGVGENTGCHLYFYLCECWIFFEILCMQQTENWGENGTLRLHLWGVFKEKTSKPPSRDCEACHYSYLYWHHGESCRWMNGVTGL